MTRPAEADQRSDQLNQLWSRFVRQDPTIDPDEDPEFIRQAAELMNRPIASDA